MWKCQRHEKSCDGKVQLKYPGGAYHVPKTIFEKLEEEGIIVPEEARYFPYRATFDFECYFDKVKAGDLKNTGKLIWQSAHVPLSVSVCSNVPDYDKPKCFVSNSDPNTFTTEFIHYLTKISTKSASILREQFAPVFEALKQVPNRDESTEDQLAQILVGSAVIGSSCCGAPAQFKLLLVIVILFSQCLYIFSLFFNFFWAKLIK